MDALLKSHVESMQPIQQQSDVQTPQKEKEPKTKVLIVDDEATIRRILETI